MHLKLHFFPAAFPDETLHSVISRYARLCGVRNCQEAFAGLKSAAAFSQNVAFPSHLGEFVDALPSGTELSIAEVLMRHTLLPYYAPFLSMSQVEHARTLMTADGKGLMLKLGVNASRIGFASRVRLCPEMYRPRSGPTGSCLLAQGPHASRRAGMSASRHVT